MAQVAPFICLLIAFVSVVAVGAPTPRLRNGNLDLHAALDHAEQNYLSLKRACELGVTGELVLSGTGPLRACQQGADAEVGDVALFYHYGWDSPTVVEECDTSSMRVPSDLGWVSLREGACFDLSKACNDHIIRLCNKTMITRIDYGTVSTADVVPERVKDLIRETFGSGRP